MPLHIIAAIVCVVFVIAVALHGRQVSIILTIRLNIFFGHFDHNHRDLDLNNLISMIVTLTHLTWIKTRSY